MKSKIYDSKKFNEKFIKISEINDNQNKTMEKNIIMTFKMPEEQHQALKKLAENEERTKAFLIRKAIQQFIEKKAIGDDKNEARTN